MCNQEDNEDDLDHPRYAMVNREVVLETGYELAEANDAHELEEAHKTQELDQARKTHDLASLVEGLGRVVKNQAKGETRYEVDEEKGPEVVPRDLLGVRDEQAGLSAMSEASAGRVVSYMDMRYVVFAVASLQPSFAPRHRSPIVVSSEEVEDYINAKENVRAVLQYLHPRGCRVVVPVQTYPVGHVKGNVQQNE